jgi:hypothetical protein
MPYVYDCEKVTHPCARCRKPFSYVQKTKPRLYCNPCHALETVENAKVSNRNHYLTVVKPAREAARAAKRLSPPRSSTGGAAVSGTEGI